MNIRQHLQMMREQPKHITSWDNTKYNSSQKLTDDIMRDFYVAQNTLSAKIAEPSTITLKAKQER